MQTLTSFASSAVPRDQLNRILTDYVALDRARMFRRLLVARFGVLAVLAFFADVVFHGPSSMLLRSLAVVACLIPPFWAWLTERRLAQRLSERLSGVPSVSE
jgi:hypothetical protein